MSPKHLKSITHDGYVRVRNKLAKALNLGKNHVLCLTRLALGTRTIVAAVIPFYHNLVTEEHVGKIQAC